MRSLKVLYIGIAPPEDHCGVRVVLYRHLVERQPFDLLVATNADYSGEPRPHVLLRLPAALHRLRKSRFGPASKRWITDYENLVWGQTPNLQLEAAIARFQPDVVLTLADNCLSEMAQRAARRHRLPLAGLFLDWFPIMDGHYGSRWTRQWLSRRFRRFYSRCDLAFCTSDGMREVLGPHPNSHVIYPMPGQHTVPEHVTPPLSGRFRLVYVGSVERFYGRMICSLLKLFEKQPGFEFIVVGPNPDWPPELIKQAKEKGAYLGFRPPEKAAEVLAGADALLVVMSFEQDYELFMRTSFTTKFLDYAAFGKPVILWGPDYCTPIQVVRKHGGALVVNDPDPIRVLQACGRIHENSATRGELSQQASQLHNTLFSPERIQAVFVSELERLVGSRHPVSGTQGRLPCEAGSRL